MSAPPIGLEGELQPAQLFPMDPFGSNGRFDVEDVGGTEMVLVRVDVT